MEGFQSLFFWIHFHKRRRPGRLPSPSRCFNPCFSGFTSTSLLEYRHINPQPEFQSLFFWIHFHKHCLTRAIDWTLAVSILVFLDSLPQEKITYRVSICSSFVSILVFLDSLPQAWAVRLGAYRTAPFQSLFFWIHFHKLGRRQAWVWAFWGFNPCFSGFTSTRSRRRYDSISHRHVSILVFLDSLPQDIDHYEASYCDCRFQSLFFWIHFHKSVEWSAVASSLKFQSLFFWIHFHKQGRDRERLCII